MLADQQMPTCLIVVDMVTPTGLPCMDMCCVVTSDLMNGCVHGLIIAIINQTRV